MSDLKRRTGATTFEDGTDKGKGKVRAEDDPLSVLDEAGGAEPLDNEEQRKIIEKLREENKRANYIYRAALLIIQSLLLVLYLTPLPAYIAGTHPENHLTMFLQSGHGSFDDLIYLPALPIYVFFLALQGGLLYCTAYETADQMDVPIVVKRRKGYAYPAQPHPFGTAPEILVPTLGQMKFAPGGGRADQAHQPTSGPSMAQQTSPRLMYLLVLLVTSLPLPLMTFGAGSFGNAGWWALTSAIIGLTCWVENSIWKSERSTVGLDGMRYNYKGA